MQMYEIAFSVIGEDAVDIGRVITVGDNEEDAQARIIHGLDLDKTRTVFTETKKLKPRLFQIDRHEVSKHGRVERVAKTDLATYLVSAQAEIVAGSQTGAIFKFTDALKRGAQRKATAQPRGVSELSLTCERSDAPRPRTAAVEKGAIYKHHRVFQGGNVSGAR